MPSLPRHNPIEWVNGISTDFARDGFVGDFLFQSHRVGKWYFYKVVIETIVVEVTSGFNPIEWVNGISTATYGS